MTDNHAEKFGYKLLVEGAKFAAENASLGGAISCIERNDEGKIIRQSIIPVLEYRNPKWTASHEFPEQTTTWQRTCMVESGNEIVLKRVAAEFKKFQKMPEYTEMVKYHPDRIGMTETEREIAANYGALFIVLTVARCNHYYATQKTSTGNETNTTLNARVNKRLIVKPAIDIGRVDTRGIDRLAFSRAVALAEKLASTTGLS